MTKFYPKWLVDYFVMPTCASINPLLQLERHQHRITFHHLPTFHDERDDPDEKKKEKVLTTSCQRLKSPKNDYFHHHRSLPSSKGWNGWKEVEREEIESWERKVESWERRNRKWREKRSEWREEDVESDSPSILHSSSHLLSFLSFKSYIFWLIVSYWLMMMLSSLLLDWKETSLLPLSVLIVTSGCLLVLLQAPLTHFPSMSPFVRDMMSKKERYYVRKREERFMSKKERKDMM